MHNIRMRIRLSNLKIKRKFNNGSFLKLVVDNHPKLAKGQRDSGEVKRSSLKTRFPQSNYH